VWSRRTQPLVAPRRCGRRVRLNRALREHCHMNATDDTWVFADAWVLTAIGIAGAPCDLPRLIAVADGINHAILVNDEIEAALSKLSGTGLLRVNDDWTFALTETGASS
jgi:hypothetical protein